VRLVYRQRRYRDISVRLVYRQRRYRDISVRLAYRWRRYRDISVRLAYRWRRYRDISVRLAYRWRRYREDPMPGAGARVGMKKPPPDICLSWWWSVPVWRGVFTGETRRRTTGLQLCCSWRLPGRWPL